MNFETFIQYALPVSQIATLVALIIYTATTAKMARTSKASLNLMEKTYNVEFSPFVLVYFDFVRDGFRIDLVVKNTGRAVAEDIKIFFSPRIVNSSGPEIADISMLKDGIKSLPPGGEIRTFFDTSASYYRHKQPLPRHYEVMVTYRGGLLSREERHEVSHVLDLKAYEKTTFPVKTKEIDKLTKHVKEVSRTLTNVSRLIENFSPAIGKGLVTRYRERQAFDDPERWKRTTNGYLRMLENLVSRIVHEDDEKNLFYYFRDFEDEAPLLADELFRIASLWPTESLEKSANMIIPLVSEIQVFIAHETMHLSFHSKIKEFCGNMLPKIKNARIE